MGFFRHLFILAITALVPLASHAFVDLSQIKRKIDRLYFEYNNPYTPPVAEAGTTGDVMGLMLIVFIAFALACLSTMALYVMTRR